MAIADRVLPSSSADIASSKSQAPVLAGLMLNRDSARRRVCIGCYERLQRRDQLRVSCTPS
jgi:hypothetical protein